MSVMKFNHCLHHSLSEMDHKYYVPDIAAQYIAIFVVTAFIFSIKLSM